MKRISDANAKEFATLLGMKTKRTHEQNKRIREIWNAMRAKAPGKYQTENYTYIVIARKATKNRKASVAVIFRLTSKLANVSKLPVKQKVEIKKAA